MRFFVVRIKPWFIASCMLVLCICIGIFAGVNNARYVQTQDNWYPIYSVEMEEPKVALGINCAWDNADIPALLQVLEQRQVKATFFVAGSWCDDFPQSVELLYQAGHEIGSHSNSHTDMTTLDRDEVLREIRTSNEKIKAITGEAPTLFRTPSGAYNDVVIQIIREEGLTPIQWDCDSVDYQEQSCQQMKERVLKNMRNGSIFLFHSGGKNTAEALPGIIDEIQGRGYQLVTVSQLIYPEPYSVDFEGRQRPA